MPYFYDPNLDKKNEESGAQGLQLSGASATMDPAGQPSEAGASGAPGARAAFRT